MAFRFPGALASVVLFSSIALAQPGATYGARLVRFEVAKGGACGGDPNPTLSYVNVPYVNADSGTFTEIQLCGASDAKGTFRVNISPTMSNGRRIPAVMNKIKFDDPATLNLSFAVELHYPKATVFAGVAVAFDQTSEYQQPDGGGTCPDRPLITPTEFQGSFTGTATMTCKISPFVYEGYVDQVNGRKVMKVNVWTLCCMIPSSGQTAPTPRVLFDVYAVYELDEIRNEDITITHIYPVQAIQTPQEHVTLIGGKQTTIRVFMKSTGAGARSLAGVRARLRCTGSNGVNYESTSNPITVPAAASDPAPGTPPNLADTSADIPVPEQCTTAQTGIPLEVEALLPAGAQDPKLTNNKMTKTFAFVTPPGSNPLRIGYLRIWHEPPGSTSRRRPAAAAVNAAHGYLSRTYPVPESGVRYFPITLDYPAWTGPLNTGEEWRALLDDLTGVLLMTNLPEGEDYDQVVGWLPYIPTARLGGLADTPWAGGLGFASLVYSASDVFNGVTLAHELAHNLGVRHTNVAGPNCPNPPLAQDPETAWPWADARIQTHGYFQPTRQVLPPELFDFMSYCPHGSAWISPYTAELLYRNNLQPTGGLPGQIIFGDLPPNRTATAAPVERPRRVEARDVWVVTGRARADGSAGQLDAFLKISSTRPAPQHDPGGNHCLQFFGNAGLLLTHCFQLSFRDSENGILDQQGFSLPIPVIADATRVTLSRGTQELASLAAGAGLQVNITSPQAGARWESGTQTISWTSAGGAQPRYGVQYSPDGGTSWLSLGANLQAAQLTVDTSQLQGGDRVFIRVLAGSGMSTAEAQVGPINLVQNPRLSVPPGTFELHNAVAGQGIERQILLSNPGTGPLRITAIQPSSPQFRLISPALPAILMPGDEVPLAIHFVPAAVGAVAGTLRLDSNDAARPSVTIPLNGRGVESATPEIAVSPASIAFGTIQAGQGVTHTVTVTNHGPAALTLSGVFASGTGFVLAAPQPVLTLQANESRNIAVRFTPAAAGAFTGTLLFASNDPVQPNLNVGLTGSATAGGNAQLPTITAGGVVNAASFRPGLTRGALGTVFGTNLSNASQTVGVVPWPRQMAGAKVLVAGIEAPLYFVSAGQINFQVPFEVPEGPVPVVVSRDGSESLPQMVTITQYAPGVFGYARTPQAFDPIVIHLDGQLVTPANPAKAGEFVIVFITGIGRLGSLPPTGDVTGLNPLPTAIAESIVSLGGAPVESLFTGLTPGFIGLGQMNLRLPATLPAGSSLPLSIRVGSVSAPDVILAVGP